jgi:hypothetical protein
MICRKYGVVVELDSFPWEYGIVLKEDLYQLWLTSSRRTRFAKKKEIQILQRI